MICKAISWFGKFVLQFKVDCMSIEKIIVQLLFVTCFLVLPTLWRTFQQQYSLDSHQLNLSPVNLQNVHLSFFSFLKRDLPNILPHNLCHKHYSIFLCIKFATNYVTDFQLHPRNSSVGRNISAHKSQTVRLADISCEL